MKSRAIVLISLITSAFTCVSIPIIPLDRRPSHHNATAIMLHQASNQTAQPTNSSKNTAELYPICVHWANWSQPAMDYQDCISNIEFLQTQTAAYEYAFLEFLARGASPSQGPLLTPVHTPRRWKSSTSARFSARIFCRCSIMRRSICWDQALSHLNMLIW